MGKPSPDNDASLARIRADDKVIERLYKIDSLIAPCIDRIRDYNHRLEEDLTYLNKLSPELFAAIVQSANTHVEGLLTFLSDYNKIKTELLRESGYAFDSEPATKAETEEEFISTHTAAEVLEALRVIDNATQRLAKLQNDLNRPLMENRILVVFCKKCG
ncbi:MAG: hypothetical protein MMC33_004097 [Icmadophila ericetorum]|nr:hypothetical protein [Icmadophila ericetorum]